MKFTKIFAFLLVLSMIICAFSACKEEKTSDSSETEATSGEAYSSETESSVADTGSAASEVSDEVSDDTSVENSDVSNDTSTDANKPMQETDIGIKALETIEDYAVKMCAAVYEKPEEKVLDAISKYTLTKICIITDAFYDSSVDAALYSVEREGKNINCTMWEVDWGNEMTHNVITISVPIPIEDPTFVKLCEVMGVPSNKLSQLKFTPDQIKCLDEEKAQALIDCFEASREFSGLDEIAS